MDHIEKMAAKLWRSEALRVNGTAGTAMRRTPEAFLNESQSTQDKWNGIAQAAFNALMDAVPDLVFDKSSGTARDVSGNWLIVRDVSYGQEGYRVYLNSSWESENCGTYEIAVRVANAHYRKLVSEIWGGKSDG